MVVLSLREVLLAREDPDLRVTSVSIAVVVDSVVLVVSVDHFEEVRFRHANNTGIDRIQGVAPALRITASFQVILAQIKGRYAHGIVLHGEVVIIRQKFNCWLNQRPHTGQVHVRFWRSTLRVHVPRSHVLGKVKIHACRVVANV